jgi:DNA repair protein RadC
MPTEPEYSPTILHTLPVRERPVYRLHRVGAASVSLTELLAAAIGGSRQIEIAQALLQRYDTLADIARVSPQELAQVDGLGPARAAALKAALELGRRLTLEEVGEKPQIRSPADAAVLLLPDLSHQEQELFVVLLLDTRNRVLDRVDLYKGSLNQSQVRVGEVFRDAVRRNCAAVIVAHNHPSGQPDPSPEDVAVTRDLVAAGTLLGVEVLDHLVIGHQRWISLRERGLGFEGVTNVGERGPGYRSLREPGTTRAAAQRETAAGDAPATFCEHGRPTRDRPDYEGHCPECDRWEWADVRYHALHDEGRI